MSRARWVGMRSRWSWWLVMTLVACGGTNGGDPTGAGGMGASSGSGASSGVGAGASTGSGGDLPPAPPPGSCGMDEPAFCETFEATTPGGRGGDLDESVWGVSRWSHNVGEMFARSLAYSDEGYPEPAKLCGELFSGVAVGEDYVICEGADSRGATSQQLNETFHDTGDFAVNSMMIRQPFDFADRDYGTISLDVDAKFKRENDGHGWWVEVWVTDEPVPLPYHAAPSVSSTPHAGIGFAFMGTNCDKSSGMNSLTQIFVARDHEVLHEWTGFDLNAECFQTQDEVLNHLEIRLSQDKAEVWVSDAGEPDSFRKVAEKTGLDLAFTRGFVHLQHSHYNAIKGGPDGMSTQTFRWDNVGFDGPLLPRVRAYDVADPVTVQGDMAYFGFPLGTSPESHSFQGVDLAGASRAFLDVTAFNPDGIAIEYRVNGGGWHSYEDPTGFTEWQIRSYSIGLDLAELKQGDNTVEIRGGQDDGYRQIGNIDLSVLP
ncbi:MAG: hypothetical protein KC731_12495 [Myxococcales bacterium]|nr:hypothetical protein [Myxococcales bacterium]